MIAAKGSNSCGAASAQTGRQVDEAAPVEQMHAAAVHVVALEMSTQVDVGVPIQPVDVDLTVAVPDVHEDRAVGEALDLRRSDDAIETGRGDHHAGSANGVVEVGDPAAVVLRLDRPNRVEVDHRDVGAEIAGAQRNALTNGAEPDHDDLAAVQRQARDRRERRPRLGADVMPIVQEILERDPVPVQDRERDIEAGQAVQASRGGLERTGGPVARCCGRRDQLTAHVAQGVGWFAREPRQRVSVLGGRHAGVAADLDAQRGEVGCGAVVGAVRVAWRHPDSGPGLQERADEAGAVGQDVLVTRHGAARQVRGRDLRAERGGDRVRPRDPVELCGVHGSSTPSATGRARGRRPPAPARPRRRGRPGGRRGGSRSRTRGWG